MLAAALGIRRTGSLERFDALEYGVRIDQPGQIERDFQTARTLDGRTSMPLSERFYLADAVFLAGFGSPDRRELEGLQHALAHPIFPLYLGRRAFPPAGPLNAQVVDTALRDALKTAEWRATDSYRRRLGVGVPALEILLDAKPGETADLSLRDVPRSYDPRRRRHDWRDVRVERTQLGNRPHDPLILVSEEEV